jgi:hypothetical protein
MLSSTVYNSAHLIYSRKMLGAYGLFGHFAFGMRRSAALSRTQPYTQPPMRWFLSREAKQFTKIKISHLDETSKSQLTLRNPILQILSSTIPVSRTWSS